MFGLVSLFVLAIWSSNANMGVQTCSAAPEAEAVCAHVTQKVCKAYAELVIEGPMVEEKWIYIRGKDVARE